MLPQDQGNDVTKYTFGTCGALRFDEAQNVESLRQAQQLVADQLVSMMEAEVTRL
jgi:hypothetical protein